MAFINVFMKYEKVRENVRPKNKRDQDLKYAALRSRRQTKMKKHLWTRCWMSKKNEKKRKKISLNNVEDLLVNSLIGMRCVDCVEIEIKVTEFVST